MKKNVGKCSLCEAEEVELVDSHVIPKALHLDLKPKGDILKIYSNEAPRGKQNHKGVYGQFLCDSCEGLFGPYDQCGVDFVKRYKDGRTGEPLYGSFEHGFLAEVDYAKLKLWVMSMLWRADACDDQLFFKDVKLGSKWRTALTRSIQSKTPGDADHFAVVAMLFDEEYSRQGYLPAPQRQKSSGINVYRFYLPWGFTFFIKVDSRPQPQMLKYVTLNEGPQFAVVRGKYSDHEWSLLEAISNAVERPHC